MKKLIFTLATLTLSAAAMAQPAGRPNPEGPHMNPNRVEAPRHVHRKKVWVPAHRSHGHLVKGHYVYR